MLCTAEILVVNIDKELHGTGGLPCKKSGNRRVTGMLDQLNAREAFMTDKVWC